MSATAKRCPLSTRVTGCNLVTWRNGASDLGSWEFWPNEIATSWLTVYIFAYCGLVGNPHLTAKMSFVAPLPKSTESYLPGVNRSHESYRCRNLWFSVGSPRSAQMAAHDAR